MAGRRPRPRSRQERWTRASCGRAKRLPAWRDVKNTTIQLRDRPEQDRHVGPIRRHCRPLPPPEVLRRQVGPTEPAIDRIVRGEVLSPRTRSRPSGVLRCVWNSAASNAPPTPRVVPETGYARTRRPPAQHTRQALLESASLRPRECPHRALEVIAHRHGRPPRPRLGRQNQEPGLGRLEPWYRSQEASSAGAAPWRARAAGKRDAPVAAARRVHPGSVT